MRGDGPGEGVADVDGVAVGVHAQQGMAVGLADGRGVERGRHLEHVLSEQSLCSKPGEESRVMSFQWFMQHGMDRTFLSYGVSLNVVASGSLPLTYKWQREDSPGSWIDLAEKNIKAQQAAKGQRPPGGAAR